MGQPTLLNLTVCRSDHRFRLPSRVTGWYPVLQRIDDLNRECQLRVAGDDRIRPFETRQTNNIQGQSDAISIHQGGEEYPFPFQLSQMAPKFPQTCGFWLLFPRCIASVRFSREMCLHQFIRTRWKMVREEFQNYQDPFFDPIIHPTKAFGRRFERSPCGRPLEVDQSLIRPCSVATVLKFFCLRSRSSVSLQWIIASCKVLSMKEHTRISTRLGEPWLSGYVVR